MIIIDSCVFKSLFSSVNIQSVFLKPPRPTGEFLLLVLIIKSAHYFIMSGLGVFTHDYDIINTLF